MIMDFKITNYDVSTEEIYLEQAAELPIDADFMLSDFEGDIKKILNCEITPYIITKQISGPSFIIEGDAIANIIYCSSEGELCNTKQEIPFKKVFEASKSLDGGYGEVNTTAIVHSCRAVTERKISLRSSVKLNALVTVIEKSEIISDIDNNCFEQLKGDAEATTPLGKTFKTFIIDEELVLPQNLPGAKKIIRTNAVSNITDCKIVADKTIIKGNLKIDLLYLAEQNQFIKHCSNIPFNQIIDIPGISELCECDADSYVCGLDISIRNSEDNECRKLMLVSKLEISVFARCNSNIPVIYDIYSTQYITNPKLSEVKFSKLAKQIYEAFICKKVLSLPSDNAVKILDVWCKTGNNSIKYENNSAVISGAVTAYVIYENADGFPDFFERIIDFEYPFNFDKSLNKPYCHPEIKITNCDFSLTTSGDPELKLELVIHAAVYDECSYSVITELEVDENAPIKNKASLIAYYADKGENVWEIAKSFSAKRKEFLSLNKLNEDTVQNAKMLLIPLM